MGGGVGELSSSSLISITKSGCVTGGGGMGMRRNGRVSLRRNGRRVMGMGASSQVFCIV